MTTVGKSPCRTIVVTLFIGSLLINGWPYRSTVNDDCWFSAFVTRPHTFAGVSPVAVCQGTNVVVSVCDVVPPDPLSMGIEGVDREVNFPYVASYPYCTTPPRRSVTLL